MADTVDSKVLFSGARRYVINLTNESDGSGESAVVKVDISGLTGPNGGTATYSTIDRIEYSIGGFNYVTLEWNATTPDEIAVLSGDGSIDWTSVGGNTDPQSSGGSGDIQITTDDASDGDHYNITLWMRLRD